MTSPNNLIAVLARLKLEQPQNLAVQAFDVDYFRSLTPDLQARLLACMKSGMEIPGSEMGCYAGHPSDYDDLCPFFSKVLSAHHRVSNDSIHTSSWDIDAIKQEHGIDALDLGALGLPALSTRIRVGRNLEDFPLPAAMSRTQRTTLESHIAGMFDHLNSNEEFQGQYYSLTPGHPKQIDEASYARLIKRHLMFRDMSSDPYLETSGISGNWPHGRGCFIGEQQEFLVWVGEEDHLRIMCMEQTNQLEPIFRRLKSALDRIEGLGNTRFAHSDRFGNITSCPTNLGTGMRASVHLPLPKLTRDGSLEQVKKIAKRHGLAVRGMGGEHTPIGDDGTIDLSPSGRFCITEAEILISLYKGILALSEAEREV